MTKCIKCLYDLNHPFGLTLNDHTVCSGCFTHDEKYQINWDNKNRELRRILKSNKTSTYDCVIPVIGDAEDYYIVDQVLKLKLNPLIVSVNSYFLNNIGWTNLHNLITHFDLDSWIYNPEIQTYKELIRTSMRKYNHMYLPWIQLHTSFPVHVAKEKGIPFVIWGGNQSIEQAGKFSHKDQVEMSSWSRTEHDLFNKNIFTLTGNGAQVNERKINYYKYPPISALGQKVRGLYLSNFMPWDPLLQNKSTTNNGFSPEMNNYSFDPYERAGSSIYYGIHDITKFERVGYRKITDHCSREIRHKRITRKQGEKLEKLYSSRKVYIKDFFNWLDVTESGYNWFLTHRLKRSRHLIANSKEEIETNSIKLPHKLTEVISKGTIPSRNFILYDKGIEI